MRFRVKFLDYWHLSSGNSGGARMDAFVIKNKNNLPYIPAKTLKGLIREQFEKLYGSSLAKEIFGDEGVKEAKIYISNGYLKDANEIVAKNLQNYLYNTIASTKIDENGVAVDDSLREIEVVIPLELEFEILYVNEHQKELSDAIKSIKRMGLNRNRGLGRCVIEEIK